MLACHRFDMCAPRIRVLVVGGRGALPPYVAGGAVERLNSGVFNNAERLLSGVLRVCPYVLGWSFDQECCFTFHHFAGSSSYDAVSGDGFSSNMT